MPGDPVPVTRDVVTGPGDVGEVGAEVAAGEVGAAEVDPVEELLADGTAPDEALPWEQAAADNTTRTPTAPAAQRLMHHL